MNADPVCSPPPPLTPTSPHGVRPGGAGSLRERRPGVWEVRVAVGVDPVTRRTRQRSVTVHGDRADAERRCAELVTSLGVTRHVPPGPLLTVGEMLTVWLEADHPWKPSTWVGYRSHARALHADPIAAQRCLRLTPTEVRTAMRRWQAGGASTSVVAGRFRALRAALGWAYDERLLDLPPLRQMRGPGRATPRRPVPDDHIRVLLSAAEGALLEAVANDRGTTTSSSRRHRAELDLLLVRLAADTGARRGELAVLRLDDLHGRVLTIERALSAGQLTTPKSGHGRTLTVGASTAALWRDLHTRWRHEADARPEKPFGPWLFSPDPSHTRHLDASALGHRFTRLRDAAGVPEATLHRLRHSVATFLVARGEILQAQARLGHADAATTLREYAYALPLTDGAVADVIDAHLHLPVDPLPAGDRDGAERPHT